MKLQNLKSCLVFLISILLIVSVIACSTHKKVPKRKYTRKTIGCPCDRH